MLPFRVARLLLFAAALVPAGWLVWGLLTDRLGANPVDAITDETGTWALRFLVLTLAVTPVRRLTGWHALVRLRRMLGLFAFFYAALHVLTYVWLDHLFDVPAIAADVVKRPFVTMGALAFVLLLPLAVTSTAGWIRRLGGRRWQMLHWLVYPAAVAAVVHYLWLVKLETDRPLRYAAVLAILFAARAGVWWRRRPRSRAQPARLP